MRRVNKWPGGLNPKVASKIRARWSVPGSLQTEDTKAINFLEAALDNANSEVADAAADALTGLIGISYPEIRTALEGVLLSVQHQESHSHLPSPHYTPILLDALGKTETYVRHCAVKALVSLGATALPDLLEALKSPEALIRACAAWALGEIADPNAIPALAMLLQDNKRIVRDGAGYALARYGSLASPLVVEALRDERSRLAAVETLGWIGDASTVPALLDAMQLAAPYCTWEYWMAFERIGAAARPYILEALQDPYEFRRASAVTALSAIGDTGDVPLFIQALQDPGRHGRVRTCAAEALTSIPDPVAVPALLKALQDEHENVRVEAISALRACGDIATVAPHMVCALSDNSLRVRDRALGALAAMGSAALPILEQSLLDPREPIRVAAATALLRIDESTDLHSADLPRRLLLLPSLDASRKGAALEALEKAHYPMLSPADFCRELLTDSEAQLRQSASEVLRFLKTSKKLIFPWRRLHFWK